MGKQTPYSKTELEKNKEIVRRFMAGMDNGDFAIFDEVWAPDIIFHLAGADLDREQAEGFVRMVYESFPDLQHTLEDLMAVGDKVVLRATNRATHRGEFQGVAATGRRISIGQIAIYRIADGRIAEVWEEVNLLGLWQQLGVEIPGK